MKKITLPGFLPAFFSAKSQRGFAPVKKNGRRKKTVAVPPGGARNVQRGEKLTDPVFFADIYGEIW